MMDTTTPIARGPLGAAHRASRARIVALNKWEVAAEFDGCAAELARAGTTVSIADLSHLPKLQIVGRDLEAFCARPVPTDQSEHVGAPQSGRAWVIQSNSALTQLAQDSVLCACLAEDQLIAISSDVEASAGGIAQLLAGHSSSSATQCKLFDITGHFAVFDLVGPCGEDLLCQLTSIDISARSLPPGRCAQTGVARIPAILIRPTGTALARIQVWCAREYGHYLGETLLEKAAPIGGGPLGWEAWRATFG